MKVLLSIKPEYANKILAGEKHFEFRKAIFKNPLVKTVVIYATLPIGKVVGEFEVESVMEDDPNQVWSSTSEFAGISQGLFQEYFQGRKKAYAIKVSNPQRYLQPLELSHVVSNGVAPQSFCYLKADE